jgi:hypothetical protein
VDAAKHGGQAVVDGARRAEHAAEGVLSKGAAKAGVAEEKTGRVSPLLACWCRVCSSIRCTCSYIA